MMKLHAMIRVLSIVFTAVCVGGVFPISAADNVVVILDDSGSMRDSMGRRRGQRLTRMDAAKSALVTVLEQLPEDAHVGIATLNRKVRGQGHWIVPLGPVDVEAARNAIGQVQADGGTPLGEFLKRGADALLEKRAAEHYGTFRLLVVTDGEANDGTLLESYLPDVLSRGITVDVIGVDMDSDHSLATQVHSYRRADDPESLTEAVQEVFAETTGGSAQDGSDDFELLQPLPDDVAQAVLLSLGESGNQPIQAVEKDGGPDPGSRSKSGGRRVPWLVLAVVAYVFVSILRSVTRRKTR
ncbi:MAG: vWA domain-containing protein [Planctomycetota bacterium]